jgi:hypothetical protein
MYRTTARPISKEFSQSDISMGPQTSTKSIIHHVRHFTVLYPGQKHCSFSSVCGSSWAVLIQNYIARLRIL